MTAGDASQAKKELYQSNLSTHLHARSIGRRGDVRASVIHLLRALQAAAYLLQPSEIAGRMDELQLALDG